jgi:hypothetical protein
MQTHRQGSFLVSWHDANGAKTIVGQNISAKGGRLHSILNSSQKALITVDGS